MQKDRIIYVKIRICQKCFDSIILYIYRILLRKRKTYRRVTIYYSKILLVTRSDNTKCSIHIWTSNECEKINFLQKTLQLNLHSVKMSINGIKNENITT